jgi:hypothetical protein
VEVGLGHQPDLESSLGGDIEDPVDVALRVDDRRGGAIGDDVAALPSDLVSIVRFST